ncbi:MAG TPA: hypothetical protein VG435_15430, partial [Acidimicrobiales bacterium]|nr:hypothetical protein [Acidimicrobiales bacterium]
MSEIALNLEDDGQPSGLPAVDRTLGLRTIDGGISAIREVPRTALSSHRGLAVLLMADTLAIGSSLLIAPAVAELLVGRTPA